MPSISAITPATFDSGRSVTLTGSGFGASQGSILIAGEAQAITSWSDTSITFTTVRGAQSPGACRVDVKRSTSSPVSVALSASGWGQSASKGGTITGPAPLAIWVDAIATTHSDTSIDTFRELGYHFDFGYATPTTPGTWTYSGKPKGNQVGGPAAAHVYETPGTYTLSVRAQDANGARDDATLTIVVEDPDTYWSSNGRTTTTLARSSITAWPTWGSNTRYLLEAGQDYSALGRLNILNKQTVCIGKTGAGADPIVGDISFDRSTGANSPTTGANVQFMMLNGGRIDAPVNGSDCLFYKCAGTELLIGTLTENRYLAYPAYAWPRPKRIVSYECSFNGADLYLPYVEQAWQFVMIGCSSFNPREHSLRVQGSQYGFIGHNKLYDAGNAKHYLTIRADGVQDIADTISSADTQTPASRYIVAADNVLGDATDTASVDWPCYIGPQNSISVESLEFILSERSVFSAGAVHTSSVFTSVRGCRNITVRDETYGDGSSVGVQYGESYGAAGSAWFNGPAYSNKFINPDPDGVYSFSTPTAILPSKAGA